MDFLSLLHIQPPHVQIHRLLHTQLLLEETLVVGRLPWTEHDRGMLVTLDQQAALVVGREVHRTDNPIPSALAQPGLGGVQ
jgi:hypothetical protein